jgi:flagellar biogenesis protein FliO
MSVIRLAMFALVLFVAPAAFAQEEAPDAGATPGAEAPRSWLSPRKGFSTLTSTDGKSPSSRGWGLGLFLFACAGGTLLLVLKKKKLSPKVGGELQVLTSTRLGPKSQLVIAQVDGRRILLGVTDGSIQRLAWLKRKPQNAEVTITEKEPEAVRPAGFAAVLNDAFASFRKKEQPAAAITLAAETEDKVQLRSRREPEPQLVRVEAQAAGLLSRLKELQQ